MLDQKSKQMVIDELVPRLEKLVDQMPQYGEISLRVKICDYKVGTTNLGVEISQRTPKSKEGD